jgi:hypothetical protein
MGKATKFASIDALLNKPARTSTVQIGSEEDGLQIKVKAIGNTAYDKLIESHPPTPKQKREDDAVYNPETFPPALIAASAEDPKLTYEQATELWKSDAWSRGEMMGLFSACLKVNSAGLGIPFTGTD